MSRKTQIEEMAILARVFCQTIEDGGCCEKCSKCGAYKMAERFYTAGYRKQSEGEWVVISKRGLNSKRNRRINYETYICAVCGRSNGKYKANFCPDCGARMKGENK